MDHSAPPLGESAVTFLKANRALLHLLSDYAQKGEVPDYEQVSKHLDALEDHRAGAVVFLHWGGYELERAESIIGGLIAAWKQFRPPYDSVDLKSIFAVVKETTGRLERALLCAEAQSGDDPSASSVPTPEPAADSKFDRENETAAGNETLSDDHVSDAGGEQPPASAESITVIGETGLFSAPNLAEKLNQSVDAVDAFLRRYREKYPDCYTKTESRRRNEPHCLYRVSDVLAVLQEHFKNKK